MSLDIRKWPLAMLILGAAILLYRAPYFASNMETVPDTVEYVAMGWRAAREGKISLPMEGRDLPSRYQPWFSLVLLTPMYAIPWAQPGDGIWPVYMMSVIGVMYIIRLARLGAGLGGALAALGLLLFLTDYSVWARKILTDAPATALVLVLAYRYATVGFPRSSLKPTFGEAALLFLITLWRPMLACFALPFLYNAWRKRAWSHFSVYAVSLGAAVFIMAMYNTVTFGHPLRSGYVFWCSDIIGFGRGTFSTAHFLPNMLFILEKRVGWLWVLALGGFAWPAVRRAWLANAGMIALVSFLIVGALPFAFVHLLYFFPDTRFFLPVSSFLAVVAGIHVGLLMGRISQRIMQLACVVWLAAAIAWRVAGYHPVPPPRRLSADAIRTYTPANAVVVSAIDPVYLWLMSGRDNQRQFVAISREVEYASKTIQAGWLGKADLSAAAPGIQYVAMEQMEDLSRRLKQGEAVFVDTRLADDYGLAARFDEFMRNFKVAPVAEHLWQLMDAAEATANAK